MVEAEIVGAAPGSDYDASQIPVLEGLEAVRKRPGMYIGSTGERGLHHLVWEIVDNSVDEALAGFADTIDVTLLRRRWRARRRQRPRHPHRHPTAEGKSAVELVLTQLHAGGKFGGGGYKVSGGLHGVGSSVVNALSTRLDVEVCQKGHVFRMTFDDGEAVAPLEKDGGVRPHRHDDHLLGRRRHLRDDDLRLRDDPGPVPADGLPQQGPDHQPLDERRARASRRRTRPRRSTSSERKPRKVSYRYDNGLVDYVTHLVASKKAEPVHPDIISIESRTPSAS